MSKTAVPQTTALRTQHRAAINELDRYKLLVESVQDYAIFLLDKDGHIVSWNKGAQKNKGYTAAEIIGEHFSKFYTQEDIDADKPERELDLAKKLGRVEDEDWRVRKDGSQFWANVVITPLYEKGELVGFAKVTRDLTERKNQEDTLRQANQRLKKQQLQLEKMNISKDEFISLASHQLRTPATAVKQLLGLLLEGLYGELPEGIVDVLQRAYTSNERQIHIVNSLLRVAQLDAGKVIIKKEPLELTGLLRDIAEEHADSIQARQQQLQLDLPTSQVCTDADTEHLRMAISNLIDNASKYTPDAGTITISLSNKDKSPTIRIADTGVGIADQDQAKLFTKFTRLSNPLSDKVSGSGLGLYWAKRVIELHEGEVEVESTENQGTTFIITLPARKDSNA